MDKQHIRAQFAAHVSGADADIQLDLAALQIAAEAEPGLVISDYLDFLDKMAKRFEVDFDHATNLGVSITSLNEFIYRAEGFSGNIKNYYEPRNSYLNHVINTHEGIPITLALLHICLGRRLQLPVYGISFPGHFLVRYGHKKPVIVDPFSGRILSEADCATLLQQIAGPRALLRPEYFEVASNKSILIRMLDNLKQIFWRNQAWDDSKSCIERQLLLLPGQQEFNVQLGAVYEYQGKLSLAQHTYTQVLADCQDPDIKVLASQRLLALGTSKPTIH
ncbi:MAG: transglutaminase-like domain-containing protein [Pseudomonadales bacterium]|jgi:regulator of sirC expression with transglutaminase-like and TPR domain|nr:transglutaminase-like domain-containing protein [Pseudomonadales bacterium]MDP4639261.1 transglutaminase-like domain-containing protein [Pseudomonadales bacterium]MDP4765446.1 transglutaminase-like domain-containing protein [Pseudomonadales bacterium]MDP4876577.1 transglutaminase-like domain-containing protein [Pseudomonadales bacterium]MDP4911505.1 transglutaminase-like domain-containing protein [Pseudomonadales bacterium]